MVGVDIFLSSPSNAIEASDNVSNDEGIMSLAAPTPVIAIDVSSATNDGYGNDVAGQVETAPGAGTAYRSHKVKITGSNIMSYNLSISGPAELTGSSGVSTKVSGANGKTGAEMSTSNSNIWGYAWGKDNDVVEEMAYNTMSTSGTGLTCDNPSSTYSVNCERKLVFGANFSTNAEPGTYTAKVALSLTATPAVITYTLNYDANGGVNAPATQTIDSANSSVQFTISGQGNMTKNGYNFLGWSTNSSATVADANYAPSKTVTLLRDNPSKELFAVWKAMTLDGITTMQEMAPAICQNAANGATKTLTDARDNNTYVIVKYGGKCWMQQNLRLKGATNLVDPQNQGYLTPNDSDVEERYLLPATLNGSGTSVSGWKDTNTEPVSAYFNDTTKGVYYNWTAAIAMTNSSSITSGDAHTSVCPNGWSLPTNVEYSSMLTLEGITDDSTGSTKIRRTPYSFVYTGVVGGGGLSGTTVRGHYWSRTTAMREDEAYNLDFGGSFTNSFTADRLSGFPVRCVADY